MTTLNQVIDNVLQKLKEETNTPTFWGRDEIERYALEALQEVSGLVKPFKKNQIIIVEVGKRKYELPDDFIELNRIEFDEERIIPTSSEELDQVTPTWRNKTGDPEAYFRDQCLPEYFEVYKLPDTAGDKFTFSSDYGVVTAISSSGDTWTLSSNYGVITDITATDTEWEFNSPYGVVTEILSPANNLNVFYTGYCDEPELTDEMPKPFHKNTRPIEDYCIWQALSKEGETQNQPKAAKYEGYWMRDLNQLGLRRDIRRRDLRFDSEDFAATVRKHPKLPDEYPDYEL